MLDLDCRGKGNHAERGAGRSGFKNTNVNNKGRFIDLNIVKLFIAATCLINVLQYWRHFSM